MISFATVIGLFAAACTTLSYVPQAKKVWRTGKSGDLSLRMLIILATGLGTWIAYGVLQRDPVIILANSASLALLVFILNFKLRESRAERVSRRAAA